jgi:hypothetical protein
MDYIKSEIAKMGIKESLGTYMATSEARIPFKKILNNVKDIQGPFTIVVMKADGPRH